MDALLRQQMGEHQAIIASHHKEMQELRVSVKLSLDRSEALYQLSAQELKDFQSHTVNQIRLLKEKMIANESIIDNQKNTIKDLQRQLDEFQKVCADKVGLDNLKKETRCQTSDITKDYLKLFQEHEQEMRSLFQSLQDDFLKLKYEASRNFDVLHEKINDKFKIAKSDKEVVLKEIHIWEKTIFIIEKKIENIYTLIDRINKRNEVCHKPE